MSKEEEVVTKKPQKKQTKKITKKKVETEKVEDKKAETKEKDVKKASEKPSEKEKLAAKDQKKEGEQEGEQEQEAKKKPSTPKVKKARSKKYQAVRSKIDRTRAYDPFAAVELVKKLSYSKFTGTISAHLTVREIGLSKELALPHSTGQTRKVEIFSDDTIKKIEDGNIDFDVLLATPQSMGKLTKFAPILGPKGLMPNPKNGTLTTNPEQRKEELSAGTTVLKTERKAPLIHVSIGKTDMETEKLVENIKALFVAFKGKVKKMTISATMSPGVKVVWEVE
ncbi:MAG: 50S ribosomal protein L1 [Microgenomates bacterium 39_7]|nr:MAG: 50S ribosomal protein L1 [Microgenomates bacterium 39_7]